jgi:hypothetical protein
MYLHQIVATIESAISNVYHTAGNGDRSQADAKKVFANRFISEIYFLNGRKVVT